jgi:hypothetical protein
MLFLCFEFFYLLILHLNIPTSFLLLHIHSEILSSRLKNCLSINLSRDLSVVASIEEFSDLGYRLFFSWWL